MLYHNLADLSTPTSTKNPSDLPYLAAISHFQKFTARHFRALEAVFPTWQSVWEASVFDLIEAGLRPPLAEEFVTTRRSIDPEKIWETITREQLQIITPHDQNYPSLLAKIYDPPAILFYRGTLPDPESMAFGVVGTRLITPYGKQVVDEIVPVLTKQGLVIVSGLALGIDGAAHEATIASGGVTVAVLGSGLDRASVYPGHHRHLADQIIDSGGAVMTEYPPGSLPTKYHFPARNRIIAGLSIGVLVVEAKEGSGSLITARFALDEGREVFAVPGSITNPTSQGPHELIKLGATLTTCAEDILQALHLSSNEPAKTLPVLEGAEAVIYSKLSREPQHIDDLAEMVALDISTLTGTLALMELKGLVKNIGSMRFVKG